MATYFIDYQQAVLADYQLRKHGLPLNLSKPTPARLKEQSIRVCTERFLAKDAKTISDFFGAGSDKKSFLSAIDQCSIHKFRPLINFLNKESARTDEKNIELLAWLIDFPGRPFNDRIDYTSFMEVNAGSIEEEEDRSQEANEVGQRTAVMVEYLGTVRDPADHGKGTLTSAGFGSPDEQPGNPKAAIPVSDKKEEKEVVNENTAACPVEEKGIKPKPASRKVVVVGLLVFVLGGGAYWWRDNNMPLGNPMGNGRCMYWKEDHYEAVPCNQKIPNTMVLALDEDMMRTFRKITRPDTISTHSKGHVWYSKINNVVEFFTADGAHPVVFGRKLKPATAYMIGKYAKNEPDSIP